MPPHKHAPHTAHIHHHHHHHYYYYYQQTPPPPPLPSPHAHTRPTHPHPPKSSQISGDREIKQALREAKLELKKSKRKNYYKILKIDKHANDAQIKKA
jgi:hypothetical protein